MNTYLLVEDSPERIDWFIRAMPDVSWHITRNPLVAIEWLGNIRRTRAYEGIYLDHDLGTEPYSGGDVARFIIANRLLWVPKIIVHSVNVVSAPDTVGRLTSAGFEAEWIPFPTLVDRMGVYGKVQISV